MHPAESGAMASEDGSVHVIYIGKTTGKVKELLHLETKQSAGGMPLMLTGIKTARVIKPR